MIIPILLSHSDFCPVHTHLFSVVKTKSSLSKLFSDLSCTVFSRWHFSFSARVRLKQRNENATLCQTLWGFVQKNDISESISDHFGVLAVQTDLCFKSNTRYLNTRTTFSKIFVYGVFLIAFAVPRIPPLPYLWTGDRPKLVILGTLYALYVHFMLYLFCGYDWISCHCKF